MIMNKFRGQRPSYSSLPSYKMSVGKAEHVYYCIVSITSEILMLVKRPAGTTDVIGPPALPVMR